jgi:WD40 repeat protein
MRRRAFPLGIVLACTCVLPVRGQAIKELHGHSGAVYAVAFRPDGQRMATASFDRTIKVWDAHTGRILRTLTGHSDKVLALAYSADGKQLASAGRDGLVRLWDPVSGKPRACLNSRNQCVQGIAFTPDGQRLLACGEKGIAETWQLDEQKVERSLRVEPSPMPLYAVAVSPDGKSLALGCQDGGIHVHDLPTGRRLRVLDGHVGPVFSVVFSPDGASLLSGSSDQTLRRWNASTGEQLACLDVHGGEVYQVGFSGDGRRLVSAGIDGAAIVWDTATGRALYRHRFPGKTLCAAFTPDGRHVGAGTEKAACYLIDLPRHVR